jgi:hypothetical protein
MNKLKLQFIFLFALISKFGLSQHFEPGFMLGASNYYGDLAPRPVLGESHFVIGGFARVNMSSSFAITFNLLTTSISGDDKNFEASKLRNLNFKTSLTEFSGVVEFNFFKYGVDVNDKRHTPYVFLGLSFTQFNPTANYVGQTIQLRNIRTEETQYSLFAVTIPMGIGYKWQFDKHFAFNWNIGFRRSYSDYLDDVSTVYPDSYENVQSKKGSMVAIATDPSGLETGLPLSEKGYQRGNADFTDWYIISTFSISYRFYKRLKCRRFY